MKSAIKKRERLKTICSVLLILVFLLLCGCKKKLNFQDYLDLGEKYLTEANYEEAIVAFTKAIEIDPKQAAAYEKRADVYMAWIQAAGGEDVSQWTEEIRGFYTSGEADYLKAIELEPQTVSNYEKLAELYQKAGETQKAIDILKKGYEATGDESLSKRMEELEASLFTSTVDPSVFGGTMSIEMYTNVMFSFIEYLGKDVYSYDEIGRMTSHTFYDFDGTLVESYQWDYDDAAGKTYETRSEPYREGMEGENGKENGQESTGSKGERLWNSSQEIEGCKDQANYTYTAGNAIGDPSQGTSVYYLVDPTRKPENGRIPFLDNGEYAIYDYDSLGRVSIIYSYNAGGVETGHCIITYSSGE